MRTRRTSVWILTTVLVLGTAAWIAAGWSPASASTVVTATDASQELSLLGGGDVTSTGFNCNQVCPSVGACNRDSCHAVNPLCHCRTCAGELKCVHD